MVLLKLDRNFIRLSARLFQSCHVNHTTSSVSETHSDLTTRDTPKPLQTRFLKVALLGRPNAGKSTIINRVVSRAVCPTSSKVHTTRHNAKAVFTEGNVQVVFMDTPGALSDKEINKYKSAGNNITVIHALKQAHLIGLVHDVSDNFNKYRIQSYVLDLLKNVPSETSIVLIFNKVDKLKKKDVLLDLTRTFKSNEDLPRFEDIFMVSALNGSGIDDLKNYMLDLAHPGEWEHSLDEYTDQQASVLIEETVKAKLLDSLPNEIPYKLKIKLTHMEVRPDGSMMCLVELIAPTARIVKLLLKGRGKRIRTLSQIIEEELRHAFQNAVSVLINVKVG